MTPGSIAVLGACGMVSACAVSAAWSLRHLATAGYTLSWSVKFEPRPAASPAAGTPVAVALRTAGARPDRPALASVGDAPDMLRTEAAALLGIRDRDARALAAAGVLDECPFDGRAARVTKESVRRFLAERDAGRESSR